MRWFLGVLMAAVCLLGRDESYCQPESYRPHPPSKAISLEEREALVELYDATDGNHWKNHEGWLGPVGTECTWHGVECEYGGSQPSRVIDLNLSDNNLSGRLRSSIGKLARLQRLFLFGNNLSGTLPGTLIQRWQAASLWVNAEAPQFTDVTEIDYEESSTSVLCARHRLVLASDSRAILFTERCRNASPDDRRTYCEVKKGRIWGEAFGRLAWILEKNGFFALKPAYQRNITDVGFSSTRVNKNGRKHEVVDYAGGGPLELWTIEAVIEGAASSISWDTTEEQSECPRWESGTVQH